MDRTPWNPRPEGPGRIAFALALALVLNVPAAAPLHAQNCDYMIVSANWSQHPHPDSIYVNFVPNVDGPASTDPLNPTQYDMSIAIRFNGLPLEPDHPLVLRWWHGIGCPVGCPNVICEEKEWSYKGVVFRDRSFCTLNAQNVCGCPPLGTPVPHQKSVRKPPGPGQIEIEIIPLNLQSCNPINPGNNKVQFGYPSGPSGSVPGASPRTVALLVGALAILGWLTMRRGFKGGTEAGLLI